MRGSSDARSPPPSEGSSRVRIGSVDAERNEARGSVRSLRVGRRSPRFSAVSRRADVSGSERADRRLPSGFVEGEPSGGGGRRSAAGGDPKSPPAAHQTESPPTGPSRSQRGLRGAEPAGCGSLLTEIGTFPPDAGFFSPSTGDSCRTRCDRAACNGRRPATSAVSRHSRPITRPGSSRVRLQPPRSRNARRQSRRPPCAGRRLSPSDLSSPRDIGPASCDPLPGVVAGRATRRPACLVSRLLPTCRTRRLSRGSLWWRSRLDWQPRRAWFRLQGTSATARRPVVCVGVEPVRAAAAPAPAMRSPNAI